MKLTIKTLLSAVVLIASLSASYGESGVPKDYPLKKCPVSDEVLGEHGKPVKVQHEGTDVWLCCKSCIKDFNKEPGKFADLVKSAASKK